MNHAPMAFVVACLGCACGAFAQAEPTEDAAPAHVTPPSTEDQQQAAPARSSAEFKPSVHGFAFVNRFEGTPPLPKSLRNDQTTIGAIAKLIASHAGDAQSAYGLCGGMSAAAADLFLSRVDRLPSKSVPANGSPLFEYLVQRQTDSLGAAALMALKFAEWMTLPDAADDFGGVEGRTALELPELLQRLEANELVPIGLVYSRAGEGALWDNHQVLAYGCSREGERIVRIHLYDPNWPSDDNAELRVTLSAPLASKEASTPAEQPVVVNRATTRQVGSRGRERTVRGFFAMPYAAKQLSAAEGQSIQECASPAPTETPVERSTESE